MFLSNKNTPKSPKISCLGMQDQICLLLMGAVVLFMAFVLSPFCKADYINFDSAYQFFLTKHSMADIWRLLPLDYSPPLYTLIVKASVSLFGETLYVMRMTSLFFFAGMIFLALFPVRRAFGVRTALVCAILYAVSGVQFVLAVEIRPTTAAYFFVTATAVYAYLAFFTNERYAYICMTVFSVLSMYTHNVGMLSALSFYIGTLLFCLVTKEPAKGKKFFVSGCICAVLYIPWLVVVIGQFRNVLNHYWKNLAHTPFDVFEWTVQTVFAIPSYEVIFPVLGFVVIDLIIAAGIFWVLKRRDNNGKLLISKEMKTKILFLAMLYLFPIAALELFCLLVYPVIVARYFYIFAGIAALLMGLVLSKCSPRIGFYVLMGLVLVNACMEIHRQGKELAHADLEVMVDRIREECGTKEPAFVHAHEWTLGIMMYYFPQAKHYIADDTWCVLNTYDVFPARVVNIGEFDRIAEYEEEAYFFDGFFPDVLYELDEYYLQTGEYLTEECGMYREPYSYQREWRLCKVYAEGTGYAETD